MANKSIFTRLYKSALGVLLARILAFVAVFGFNAVLARTLTPAEFGQFILLFSLAGLASLLGCVGMNRAIVKVLAEMGLRPDQKKIRQTINLGVKTGVVGGTLVGAIGGILVWNLFPTVGATTNITMAFLFAAIVFFRTVHLVVAETARGFHEKLWSNLFGGPAGGPIPHVIFLVALVVDAIWLKSNSLAFSLTLYLASYVLTLPPLVWRIYTLRFNPDLATAQPEEEKLPSQNTTQPIFLLALPLMFTQTFGLTMSQADVWLAGAMIVPASLAIYCAAQRMLAFLTIPLQIAGTAIVSFVPELIAQDKKKSLQDMVGLSATAAGIPSLIIGLCFFIFPEAILTFAFGEYFSQAANLLRILAVGQLICVITGPCEIVLMMAGHQNKTLIVNAVAAVAIFTLGPLGIVYFGLTGLALAISTITSVQNLVNWFLAKRLLGIYTNMGAINPRSLTLPFHPRTLFTS